MSSGAIPMTVDQFWAKTRQEGPCLVYAGYRDRKGYGELSFQFRRMKAHRLAYELTHGSIPEGEFICHRCDNPPCILPEHLFAGTPKDNIQDACRKMRMHYGEAQGVHVLTEENVRAIRRTYVRGVVTHAALAAEFGVAASTIQHVLDGKHWGWLK